MRPNLLIVGLLGLGAQPAACVWQDPEQDDRAEASTTAETADVSTGSGEGTDDTTGTAADETGGGDEGLCAPSAERTCGALGGHPVRGLMDDEWLGVSTPEMTDFIVGAATIARQAPVPEHPAYGLVLLPGHEGSIAASLTDGTRAVLEDLTAALPTEPGPYGGASHATVRLGDRQMCGSSGRCAGFDALVDEVAELDEALLEAWHAQESGDLYPLGDVTFVPWPLDVPWGSGGTIEVSKQAWASLGTLWYFDDGDRHARVVPGCADPDCTTWEIDVTLLDVVVSPLSADQHRDLLLAIQIGLSWIGIGIEVHGGDYNAVQNAQVLSFEDPDDPSVGHTLTVVTRPSLNVDVSL